MQYSVPQFIDVEDKIVGPLTAKQTIIFLVSGGFLLLIFSFFKFGFFILALVIIFPGALIFAFYKPKGITVAQYMANFTKYYTSNHVYIWQREGTISMFKTIQKKKVVEKEAEAKTITRSRIRELAWVLDTSTSVSVPYEAKERPDEAIRR